jgi:hypothetical protein
MLAELQMKKDQHKAGDRVNIIHCSYHDLQKAGAKKYDHIISNFGGLNCTDQLEEVLLQFGPLLKKDGKVTLMIMPKISQWELIMALKGKFKTAFRRFRKHTLAHVAGQHFFCYYYSPGMIKKTLKHDFETLSLKGVCITVPPEYYINFVERYPKTFSILKKIDKAIGTVFPFTYCCDHFLITLQKK